MLSYAFTALNQGGYENVETEEFENLHNLFAAILTKGIGRQLKQGLYREYLSSKEDLAVVRGKIDMPGSIQHRLARKRALTCEYDELSENNLLNQILKTTVIPWALDDGVGTYLPVMQSDITLTQGNRVLIIDAKYYTHTMQTQYDVHTLHSANLYQIFTYVKNRDTEFGDQPHEVSGMLLYARTDEIIQPDNIYQMSGNQISVKTLDLNQEFSEITKQLNAIVSTHFGTEGNT